MGYVDLHGHFAGGIGESSFGGQHLEQVHRGGDPWLVRHLAALHPIVRVCCAEDRARMVYGTLWHRAGDVPTACVLCALSGAAAGMLSARLCMEVRKKDVLSSNIPSRAGDSEIQCTRLSAANGTVPESGSKSTTGTKNAEAERICFQCW